MTCYAFKVLCTKRPYSEDVIGYRLVLARVNKDHWNYFKQQWEQSFRSHYRVAESGDFSIPPAREEIEKWLGPRLQWLKIDGIIPY